VAHIMYHSYTELNKPRFCAAESTHIILQSRLPHFLS